MYDENKDNLERSGQGAESNVEEGQDINLTDEQPGDAIGTDQDGQQPGSTNEKNNEISAPQAPPKNTGIAIVNLDSDSPEVKEVLSTKVSVDKIKNALENPEDISDKPWSEIQKMQTPAAGGGRRRSHRRKSSNRKRSKSRKGSRKRKGSRRRK